MPRFARLRLAPVALLIPTFLTGCALTATAPSSPVAQPGVALQGRVHGGQQPVSGAAVYLYAAGTSAYGGASVSLLQASTSSVPTPGATTKDANGNYYVTTDANGGFSISGDYTCTAGQQVYLYAVGGNPGSGTNAAASFLAILGNCPGGNFATQTPTIWMNEVSTVAAAYAFAGFATDATHVSTGGSALAQTGITNAFANAANLVNLATGVALTKTPSGLGTVPQTTINSLANLLAACINTKGAVTGPTNPTTCYTLFSNAQSAGSTGTMPSETATAAINIAHHPGNAVSALYVLQAGLAAPFSPALTSTPNDLTLTIGFGQNFSSLYNSLGIAIDGSGNAWIPTSGYILGYNTPTSYVVELSPSGYFLSPTDGYPGGSFVAIDPSGGVWTQALDAVQKLTPSGATYTSTIDLYTGGTSVLTVDGTGNAWFNTSSTNPFVVAEASSNGNRITGPLGYADFVPGYEGGGISYIQAGAIDGFGNAWFVSNGTNSINEFSAAGVTLSPSTGFTPGGLTSPKSIAIDSSNNVWATSYSNPVVAKISNAGVTQSGTTGFPVSVFYPQAIAVDGSSNVWVAGHINASNASSAVVELSNAGSVLSGPNAYVTGGAIPSGIAVDGSGNVWVANAGGVTYSNVTETIGVATPVVTPLSVGSKNNTLGTRP